VSELFLLLIKYLYPYSLKTKYSALSTMCSKKEQYTRFQVRVSVLRPSRKTNTSEHGTTWNTLHSVVAPTDNYDIVRIRKVQISGNRSPWRLQILLWRLTFLVLRNCICFMSPFWLLEVRGGS